MKQRIFFVAVCVMSLFQIVAAITTGQTAPPFSVTSGDGKTVALDTLKGKIVVVLYETKNVVEQNRALKTQLTTLYEQFPKLKQGSVVVPVINCSSASWLTKKVWRSKLRENSSREKLTIYGDWDGNMADVYQMTDNQSNVVIIDATGVVRFVSIGACDTTTRDAIQSLLLKLGEIANSIDNL